MRIIVIVLGGATAISSAFLPIVIIVAIMFSGDGDGAPGTINEIQRNTLCYPSPDTFLTLRSWAQHLDNSGIKYNEDLLKETLKAHGVIHVEEGMDVRVVADGTFLRLGPSFAVSLTPVVLKNSYKTCYVDKSFLEMTLIQWIKWKFF